MLFFLFIEFLYQSQLPTCNLSTVDRKRPSDKAFPTYPTRTRKIKTINPSRQEFEVEEGWASLSTLAQLFIPCTHDSDLLWPVLDMDLSQLIGCRSLTGGTTAHAHFSTINFVCEEQRKYVEKVFLLWLSWVVTASWVKTGCWAWTITISPFIVEEEIKRYTKIFVEWELNFHGPDEIWGHHPKALRIWLRQIDSKFQKNKIDTTLLYSGQRNGRVNCCDCGHRGIQLLG